MCKECGDKVCKWVGDNTGEETSLGGGAVLGIYIFFFALSSQKRESYS